MKEKFMRFMQGRYGVLDTLGKVLLVLGLVLAFFAPVFSGRPCDRNGILPAWLGMSHLCIFPDVFQKCEKAL